MATQPATRRLPADPTLAGAQPPLPDGPPARRWPGPGEVAAFLERVAHDPGIVYAKLDRTYEQTDRIKDALRRWQTSQATTAG